MQVGSIERQDDAAILLILGPRPLFPRQQQRVAELREFDRIEVRHRPVGHRVIKVRAKKFEFTPSRIALRKGEPVVFELTTEDVFMGLSVPELGVRADIIPGKTGRLRLTPQSTGTFDFLCDVFCGDKHEEMQGQIVVS